MRGFPPRAGEASATHEPELAGKLDLLPDRTNTLVLQADQPGRHTSRCAEYCGLEHTRMVLTVVAESEERFAVWVAERRG